MEKLGPGDPTGVPPDVEFRGKIGVYRLLARLGAGGMGQVYLARSDRGRTVAVKVVRRELAQREEFRARFRQEVQAARRVGGHWTAPVLDADTEAPVPWVATGYVAGPSLQQVVGHDHGPLPERSVRILAAGLAGALKDIHAAGLVHRDLKPSNVLVTIDGPRVIDFGIARALETVTDGGLTRTGAMIGSPGFMAPEQVRGDRVTSACDVFCLGSVLAYAATGALPFGGADSGVHALMYRIAEEEPDLTGLPEGIADLVRACLRKDPAARPTLDQILERTGAEDTVADGRFRDPWLPSALVAQLGRHAVRLLDTENPENPEEPEEPGSGLAAGTDAGDGRPVVELTKGAAKAEGTSGTAATSGAAAAAVAGGDAPTAVQPPVAAPGAPVNHQPTMVAGQAPPPPVHPAYGPPQQYAPPPQPPYGSPGATPPYGAPPSYGSSPYGPPAYDPAPEPRRGGRSTLALIAVALVVALGAGGSVYALMKGGGGDDKSGGPGPSRTTGAPTTPGPTDTGPSPTESETGTSSPSPTGGVVPTGYLGSWTATINNAFGANSRRLTITQGEVGDPVLTLVADGPTGNGTYHCVFEARLTRQPGAGGPLEIGPSTVTTGRASEGCNAGAATEVTLQPDGTLERVNTGSGEKLVYTRE
ncbi:protein kinase [Streptomyces naganishii]|uniref:protein kinase domain-containing protein n=1 Tax=Streptomyces naganishii TaxID=285447 RepID=UPI003686C64B